MDANKFTARSAEAINAAHTLAVSAGNPQIEPIHLALALLRQDQGIATSLLDKAGADAAAIKRALDTALQQLPHASGSTVQTPGTAAALTRVLAKAMELMADLQDDFVATETLLLALAIVDSPARAAILSGGASEKSLREAITQIRGSRRVTSPEADSTIATAIVSPSARPRPSITAETTPERA